MRIRKAIVIWHFAVIAWAGNASAEKVDTKAKTFYEQGKTYFEAGQFEEAMTAFTEAYNLTAEPKLLFNLAACAEGLGDKEKAKAYYQVYLEEMPDAEDKDAVSAHIEALSKEPSPAPATAATETSADPTDQPAVASTPVPDEDIDAAAYYDKPKVEKKRGPLWPPLTIGIGGMAVAAGFISAILAKNRYDGLSSTCKPDCTDDQVSKAKGPAVAADVLFSLGGVAVTAGIVGLVLLKSKTEKSGGKHALRPTTGPLRNGAFIGLEGGF